MSHQTVGPGPATTPGARAGLGASVLAFFLITLDVSGVNIALPDVGRDLGGSVAGLQWVADGYTLIFAAFMLSAGSLSDRVGARRALATGLVGFAATSAACGLAPTIGVLVALRFGQGLSAAVLVPASLALIRQSIDDPAERSRAVAWWTTGGALAIAAGPFLGGALTTAWSWRAVFFLNVPTGLLAAAALLGARPSSRRPAPIDLPGQTTVVLALSALTFAVIEGGHDGFSRPVLAASAVFIVSTVAFWVVESVRCRPMLPLGLFRRERVLAPVLAGFATNAAFYGAVFVLSLLFQQGRGASAYAAGVMFVPMALVTAVANHGSPVLARVLGRRSAIVAGLLTIATGLAALAVTAVDAPVWVVVAAMLPLGAGGAVAMPAMTSLVLDHVPADRAGVAGALLNTSRQAGGALAVAVSGGLVADDLAAGAHDSLLLGVVALAVATAIVLLMLRGRNAPGSEGLT